MGTALRIEHWGTDDRPLLEQLLGVPEMTTHVGGPESPAKISERQARYEKPDSRQYRIVLADTDEGVGWVGYWERTWQDQQVWEVGWSVAMPFQGRGIATAAMQLLIGGIRDERALRDVHAFPSVDNAASNGVCRKLGFTLLGAFDFEYPPGHPLRCNDWHLEGSDR